MTHTSTDRTLPEAGGRGASDLVSGTGTAGTMGSSALSDGGNAESSAGDAGSAGDGGAPETTCVPTGPELCNGVDDDCNSVVDDGCPSFLSTIFDKELPEMGASGGSAFGDNCPDGSALTGLQVGMGRYLGLVAGICKPLRLSLNPNMPSGYEIVLGEATALAAHPTTTKDPVIELTCAENAVLVGARLQLQSEGTAPVVTVATKLWVSCATLMLDDQAGAWVVHWTDKVELPPATGTDASVSSWLVQTELETTSVATRLTGASGAWVDRVGLGVSGITIGVAH